MPRRGSRRAPPGAATGWRSRSRIEENDRVIQVFIVDDEEPARERLKELLGDIAAEVPTRIAGEARNGLEALERLPTSGAQVLLADIRMPGMDGLELARHVAGMENAPAVVF